MPTDDERREVARRLRAIDYDALNGSLIFAFLDAIGETGYLNWVGVAHRLADLIEPERRVCEQCGKPYYPTANDQKYCCKQCKKDHYISERLSREGEVPEYITKVYGLEVEDAD